MQQAGNRKWWPWALGGLLVVVFGCGIFTLVGGGAAGWFAWTRVNSEPDHLALAPGEVFLEPAADVGPDPFSPQSLAPAPDPSLALPASEENSRVEADPSSGPVQSTRGGQPGLYGGTGDNTRCDTEQLVAFLQANPDKAAAWVAALNADPTLKTSAAPAGRPATVAHSSPSEVFGRTRTTSLVPFGFLGVAGLPALPLGKAVLQDPSTPLTTATIPAYVQTLTSLTLTSDTRVTNHSFKDGTAPPRQSLLQKGSAVLVDAYGVPRVRCACGNPLLPAVASNTKVVFVGKAWPDAGKKVSVVVENETKITTFQTGPTPTPGSGQPTTAPQETSPPVTGTSEAPAIAGCYADTREQEEAMTGDKYSVRDSISITEQGQDYLVTGTVFGGKLDVCTIEDQTIGGPIKMSREGNSLTFTDSPCTLKLTIESGELVISAPGGDCDNYFACGSSAGLDGVRLPSSANAQDCDDTDRLELISTGVPATTGTPVPPTATTATTAAATDTPVPPTPTTTAATTTPVPQALDPVACSPISDDKATIDIVNNSSKTVKIIWHDENCDPVEYHVLNPGQSIMGQETYKRHVWSAFDGNTAIDRLTVTANQATWNIR